MTTAVEAVSANPEVQALAGAFNGLLSRVQTVLCHYEKVRDEQREALVPVAARCTACACAGGVRPGLRVRGHGHLRPRLGARVGVAGSGAG